MKWGHLVLPSIAASGAGILGWLFKGANVDGTVAPSSMAGIVITALVAGVAFFQHVQTAWAAAGGKVDGKATTQEVQAIGDTIADSLNVPQAKTLVDSLAPKVADEINKLLADHPAFATLEETAAPTATELLSLISDYETAHKSSADPNHNALLWKFIDAASDAVKGNVQGEDAAATLRQKLDDKLFPGTVVVKTAPAPVVAG